MRLISEADFEDFIARDLQSPSIHYKAITEVSLKRNKNNSWEYVFKLNELIICGIKTRRGERRIFKRINGAIKFAMKVRLLKFSVEI